MTINPLIVSYVTGDEKYARKSVMGREKKPALYGLFSSVHENLSC